MKKLVVIACAIVFCFARPASASEACDCAGNGLLASYNNTDTTQAVYGYNSITNGVGVLGNAAGGGQSIGVIGSGALYGVKGTSGGGEGVFGYSTSNNGVQGESASGGASGGFFDNTSSTGGWGVYAHVVSTGTGSAVGGDTNNSTTAWAGNFNGRVYINTGALIGGSCYGNCSSDERLKRNIASIGPVLDKLLAVRPVLYEWNDVDAQQGRTAGPHVGTVAQEIERVFPDWVKTDTAGFKTVNYGDLPILMLRALQEEHADNEVLRKRVSVLEAARSRPLVGAYGMGLGLFGVVGVGLIFTRRKK